MDAALIDAGGGTLEDVGDLDCSLVLGWELVAEDACRIYAYKVIFSRRSRSHRRVSLTLVDCRNRMGKG